MLDYFEKDALVQFCEHKYVYSNYIAEYFNTISSLSYIFVGLYWLKSEFVYLKNLCYAVILTGIGSMLLHGTNNYYMELIDELAMILMGLNILDIFSKNCAYGIFKINVLTKYTLLLSVIYYLLSESYIFFVNMVTLNIIIVILNIVSIKNIHLRLIFKTLMLIVIGKIAWEIEQNYCDKFYPFFILHSLWHISGAFAISCVINIITQHNKKNKYYSDKIYCENTYFIKLNNYIKFN